MARCDGRSAKRVKSEQLDLRIPKRGGVRKGAGRKRSGPRSKVEHAKREASGTRHPLHVTLRMREDVPNLRKRSAWSVIVQAMRDARGRFGMRVLHYSVQGNHVHLFVEVDRDDSLSRGMRGLCTRLAMRLNKLFARKGPLFADRYHARACRTPREVKNALAYVLLNKRKHEAASGRRLASRWIDDRSTCVKFDGWSSTVRSAFADYDFGTSPAGTWLARVGWRRHGLLAIDHVPKG